MGILNIRPFPDDLHRVLKVEAAKRGTSVRALLIQIVREWSVREVREERLRMKK